MIIETNNNYNDKLFFKIWRNKFLRNEIKYHLELYKINNYIKINNLKELINNEYREYISIINYNTNEELLPGVIPLTCEQLIIGDECNNFQNIAINIPSNITKLTFSRHFNQPLKPIQLQQQQQQQQQTTVITELLNQYINLEGGIINNDHISSPIQIKKLKFGRIFKPIGSIPSSIKELKFGHCFNQPLEIGTIPEGVEYLIFGDEFNQPLDTPGIIPSTVKVLIFGRYFNQPLSLNVLPSNLNTLKLGKYFKQIIEKDILSSNIIIIK